jgi:hypothetical protein
VISSVSDSKKYLIAELNVYGTGANRVLIGEGYFDSYKVADERAKLIQGKLV